MSSELTVHESWVDYSDAIHNGVDVSATQIKETRLAFYAGARSVLGMIIKVADQDEATAVRKLDSILDEIDEFVNREIGKRKSNGQRT